MPNPREPTGAPCDSATSRQDALSAIVHAFLHSNLSVILILLATVLGLAALWVTPREEDPQIVVPLADVHVEFPGHSAAEVEQWVAAPLEQLLYQIDGVEHVYSMSSENRAVVTVRFYVGQDRERSLVKLYKRIDENLDTIPPGVTGWVVKPIEIDDVPIVTLTLRGGASDAFALRRVGEELAERLAAVPDTSRSYVIGGLPRVTQVYVDPDRMQAHRVSPLALERSLAAANVTQRAGDFTRGDAVFTVESGRAIADAAQLERVVVSASGGRPVYLRDVARVVDGPAEASSYVRHGWGPARTFEAGEIGDRSLRATETGEEESGLAASTPAVTIAVAKKKGANAVWVAEDVIRTARGLARELAPDDMELIVTRNYGQTADAKVNELVEALAIAVFIVIALLTLGLGWREALVVAVAVPVVFGLTLFVNLMLGYTINRVTLFALILALGLLVDDPIVDVENIARHFHLRRRASREIVMEAVAEIRPPLITATLAVIVSFLPMFFITGMMGPYMRPMALNVPVTMFASMLVAFTITPWLTYHMLRRRRGGWDGDAPAAAETDDLAALRRSPLYKLFYPLMAPLLRSRRAAWLFLAAMALLMVAAAWLAAVRWVPLKMLPFDNKNELLLVLDFDEGTTLERADAAVREFEHRLASFAEVTDFTSYVGVHSPIDFNGLVRHYYLREGPNVAEIRVNLVGKKHRRLQSHGIALRERDELTRLAQRHDASLKIVETPPGPPVIQTLVAEIYGRADHDYADLIAAARTVRERLRREPGVVDVDDTVEAAGAKMTFAVDEEKAALSGVSKRDVADTLALLLQGRTVGLMRDGAERNPLRIELRLPRELRSSAADLARVRVSGVGGALVPLSEIGSWTTGAVDQTIYHKDLQRVVYVFAETAGRAPAECVLDVAADRDEGGVADGVDAVATPRALGGRTYVRNGGGIGWGVPAGIRVEFAGEGEWQITLDVFRDLGLAFAAALIGIYILLAAQTGSFAIPLIVMLAIPLTILGIMPGFWLLNGISGQTVGGYSDPVFFTATGMIGMIALAGIVTRDAIILVDFIHLSLSRGRSLFDAILESRVVRLRPILLTTGAAMLGAAPITIDPIFAGLAWSLIFGLFASTLFTLFVIPVSYWLLYEGVPGHGAAPRTG